MFQKLEKLHRKCSSNDLKYVHKTLEKNTTTTRRFEAVAFSLVVTAFKAFLNSGSVTFHGCCLESYVVVFLRFILSRFWAHVTRPEVFFLPSIDKSTVEVQAKKTRFLARCLFFSASRLKYKRESHCSQGRLV